MFYQAIINSRYELLKIENSSHDFYMHFHKRLCIGKMISGKKYITINNLENIVSKNGIYIIPPYIAHACRTNGKCSYLIFSLDFNEINNMDILSDGAKYLKIDLKNMVCLINDAQNYICVNNDNIINYLLNYIEKNYNGNMSISDIADKLGYNKYYILHLFKEKVGISLHQYIIQLKIKQAKQKNKVDNLLEIALENGFYDQSHFIRHFKKYEGITPKKYYESKIMI